jgi:hypothetical protein
MKRYISKLLIVVFALMVYSCSEDVMDDINKNVNDPTKMTSEFIITDVMVNTAFNVVGTDLAYYASCYIEHNVGIYNQMYNAEIRTGGPTNSTTYNNSWSNLYINLYNLKVIREKCDVGGSEEGNYYTLGIAQIMTAYNMAVLTDMYGDVPWSEALQPGVIYAPKLDAQQNIYTDVMGFLDSGITNLGKDSKFGYLGDQDMYYGGDAASIELWKKLAYGLKARYTMHLSARDAQYDKVLEYANASFTSADEQCQMNYNGKTSSSPFYIFFQDRDYFGASQSFHDKLAERNDPRDAVMFEPYPGTTELVYAPNGTPKQIQEYYGISTLSVATAPTYLLSYHEIEFLKAEAYARKNDLTNAVSSLKNAVVAACAKVNIGIDAETSGTYFDTEIAPKLTSADVALKEIMIQKYIAFFEEEAVEAYNDYRRLSAMGNGNFISLSNPLNGNGKFPLRYTYGADDVTTNGNIADATGDGSYVYTENVWWAGGSR